MGFKGKLSASATGADGVFCACIIASAIQSSLLLKILSSICLNSQLLQQAGMHILRAPGQKQKQNAGMLSRETRITTARPDQSPLSIGLIDLRCSLMISKI